jgi:hypothetical protein
MSWNSPMLLHNSLCLWLVVVAEAKESLTKLSLQPLESLPPLSQSQTQDTQKTHENNQRALTEKPFKPCVS